MASADRRIAMDERISIDGKSPEELLELAKEKGIELTDEQLEKV